VRLIVVGNGGGTGFTASASGGYLVTHGKASLLMECGPGVATQLAQYTPLEQIVGVVISHMHYDNFADLLTLALMSYAATVDLAIADYSDELGRGRIQRLHVYLPPGGVEYLEAIITAFVGGSPYPQPRLHFAFKTLLVLHTYEAGSPLTIGPFTVEVVGPMAHEPGPCFGFRVLDGTATIGYSGDSGMTPMLDIVARETDLFLCDATSLTSDIRTDNRHLAAEDAGRVAARAGARQLVLTHIVNDRRSWVNNMRAMARRHYSGLIHIATVGKAYDAM